MSGWQKQIMVELEEMTEKVGLKWNIEFRESNIGNVYIVDGERTKLSFHFNFQNDCCTIQFYPEGVEPVGTCGVTPASCLKNCYIRYIDSRKLEELFTFFSDEIKKFKTMPEGGRQIGEPSEEPEISKILTLSTEHIKETTAKFLEDQSREVLIVYEKSEYGWFIYLGSEYINEELPHVPEDLANVIGFAQKHGCLWLCLDCDGAETKQLPKYEW